MISSIKLHNFRSYELFSAKFSEHGTVIVGQNGTGKTNLLEAVYVALQGTSFRGSLADCMSFTSQQSTVLLEQPHGTRRVQITRDSATGTIKKQFIINDSKNSILSRTRRLPVVLFEPNELRLITSSPTRRREFLDGLISRLDAQYDRTLRAFNRTLLQRNELLKRRQESSDTWRDHLFAWDVKFVQLATTVAQVRALFLYRHEAQLSGLYTSLAGTSTPFSVEYIPNAPLDTYEQALLDRLNRSRDYEIATGHTSCGPHREDFLISLHNQPAIKVASRGEMRTIMLAFKLLELELQTAQSDTKPIILMDDVFSELDATREQLLQEAIHDHQFIVTTTDARNKVKFSQVIGTT